MDLRAGVAFQELRRRFRTAAENIDAFFFEPRERLADKMSRAENQDARAVLEARPCELPVRAAAETGQVIGADTLRIGDEPLNPRRGAAPAQALLRALRELLELAEDFRFAEDRRVEAADDL